MQPPDRESLLDLLPLVVAFLFAALLGGTTRVLVDWQPDGPWYRRAGLACSCVLGSFTVGLILADIGWFHDRQGLLLVGAGLGAYGGLETIDMLTRLLRQMLEHYITRHFKDQDKP